MKTEPSACPMTREPVSFPSKPLTNGTYDGSRRQRQVYLLSQASLGTREMIWEFCLPFGRVVEIDEPAPVGKGLKQDILSVPCQWNIILTCLQYLIHADIRSRPAEIYDKDCCEWYLPDSNRLRANSSSLQVPMIARICHESRRVALRNGKWLQPYRVWLDPARDVLHFNRNWEKLLGPEDSPDFSRTLDFLVKSPASRLSISYHLACGIIWEELNWICPSSILDQLEQRQSYTVRIGTVVIHVPSTEQQEGRSSPIIDSDLFGPFGEKRVQLVETKDDAKLRQFAEFHEAYGTPGDIRATYFFRHCYQNQTRHQLRREWVNHRLEQAETNGVVIEDREHVWDRSRGLGVIRRNHPWVKSVLSAMPDICLAYMVRLCTGNCVEVEARERELIRLEEAAWENRMREARMIENSE